MAGRQSAERARELKDIARAFAIRAWLDTNWEEQYAWVSNGSQPVGDKVNGIRFRFPDRGKNAYVFYHMANTSDTGWVRLSDLNGYDKNTRLQYIWCKVIEWQKSFAGTGLTDHAIEIFVRPVPELSKWADDILSRFAIPESYGSYEVTLETTIKAEREYNTVCNNEAEAIEAALSEGFFEPGQSQTLQIIEVTSPITVKTVRKLR